MKIQACETSAALIAQRGVGGYREYRIPGILPAGDGALLLAFEARAENRGDWGDIDIHVLRRETTGALTRVLAIGESQLPREGGMRTYNNPVLVPDDGAVHLIYHRNYAQAFIVSSADAGKTWSDAREITDAYRAFPYAWNVCATGPGHGIRLQSGRLIVPVWLADGALGADGLTRAHWPSKAGCLYSDDHGATWHPGALAEGIENGNETTTAALPDGRVLLNIRNMNPDKRRVLALSPDGGQTLSSTWVAEALTDPWCFGAMAVAGDDVLFVNCDSETRRENLTIRATGDAGGTWTRQCEVDAVGGYADIAVMGDKALVFYERYSSEERIVKALVLKTFAIEA